MLTTNCIKKTTTLIVLILYTAIAYAQKPVYKHYTTEDNLPHDITYQIIQDEQGYIWVGTDDGLSKFNGTEFTNFSYEDGLQSNYVIDIFESNPNEYLIATWGSGLHYLKNDSIYKSNVKNDDHTKIKKTYKLNDSIVYGSKDFHPILYNIRQKEKNICYTIKNEITSKPEFTFIKPKIGIEEYGINEAFIDSTLYLFSSEIHKHGLESLKGIYIYENNKFKKLDYTKLNNVEVHAVASDNEYLFASSFSTIAIYDGKKVIDERVMNIKGATIVNLQMDNNRFYFIAIDNVDGTRKLYSYDWHNDYLKDLSSKLGINSFISDFMFDRDHSLWITTYGQGIYYLPYLSNLFFGKDFFQNPDLKHIDVFQGNLLAIAPNAVYEIENDSLKSEEKIPFHTEAFIVNDKTKEIDLISYRTAKLKANISGYDLVNKTSKSYLFHKGSLTIKLEGNAISFYKDNELFKHRPIHQIKDQDGTLSKAIFHKDKIYALFGKVGVFVIDANTGEDLELWNKKNGMHTNRFKDIAIENDTIWLASNMGVIRKTLNETKVYTTNYGLISNHINDLHIDKHGLLWVASQKGLNVCIDNRFYTIDKSLGQQSSFITKIIEHDNHIYATGNNGLLKMDNTNPFTPRLNTQLIVKQDDYEFRLTTINYINSNSLKIAYQLDDSSWIETDEGLLGFETIKEGNHQIRFKYKDSLSNWTHTKVYDFKIVLPWYNQIWFYVLITVVIFGSIILLTYHQLQKSKAKNKALKNTIAEREKLRDELNQVRTNVAQDFHDELGNKLASISVLSNLLSKKTDIDMQLHKKITQINKDAKALYSGMRDFVWAIDHKSDTLVELMFYLNNFGEELFENTSIMFISGNNHNCDEDMALPYYWSKQLVFVFKEAMTNCLKHSDATKATLSFAVTENSLSVSFKDNGIGYSDKALERRNGLSNMHRRVEKINGDLKIVSNDGDGVRVVFTGALKN